jgi:hypothetical protein
LWLRPQFRVRRWRYGDVPQNPRLKFAKVFQSQSVNVHCCGPRVKVPEIKVNVWRFSDLDRGQTVEVQMSKSVVSLTRSTVEGSVKIKELKCEGSEDRSQKNGGSLTQFKVGRWRFADVAHNSQGKNLPPCTRVRVREFTVVDQGWKFRRSKSVCGDSLT